MSILELLQHIVNEPAPRLIPEGRYPKVAESFIDNCLLKDPDCRKTPKALLVSQRHTQFHLLSTCLFSFFQKDAWINEARTSTVNLEEWASTF
jgi:mitogen-activated protein kinase kinase